VTTVLLLSCLMGYQTAAAEEILTNAAVVELVRAGMADSTIVDVIQTRGTAFDVTVAALIALRTSGVSNRVIASMLTASARGRSRTSPLPATIPDEQGVYWEGGGGPQRLAAENITLRGPRGLENETAAIRGTTSALAVKPPVTFLLRTPDDVAPEEFLLVQLFVRKDRREFRTLLGGLWRGDSVEHMAVPFESERLAPSLYRIRVIALPKGEFGFVRPGTPLPIAAAVGRPESTRGVVAPNIGVQAEVGQGATGAGAIFTFSVR
jgi:hypothetical protein